MRSRADPKTQLARIGLGVVRAPLAGLQRAPHGEQFHPFAIERDFQVVRFQIQRTIGHDGDDVLRILRKIEIDQRTPAGAEWKAVDTRILSEI